MYANVALPAVTSLTGFAFAAALLLRFAAHRRAYELVWTLGLVWYALAALCEAVGGGAGWNTGLYRTWYITGAIGVAAYLGAGTLYLHRQSGLRALAVVCVLGGSVPALVGNHLGVAALGLSGAVVLSLVLALRPAWFAHVVFAMLLATSGLAAFVVANAPVDTSLLPATPAEIVSGQAFDATTRAITPPFNISGALVLILGAVASALHFWRTRSDPRRVAANILVAVGAFVPSLATGLTRFGFTSGFYVGELLGLVCILMGFLLSSAPSSVAPRTQASRVQALDKA